jgi:hypothetical protein
VRSLVDGVQSVTQLPKTFMLLQNYPNPFNAETIISLELPERSRVKIELYNVRGQKVTTIYEGVKNAGWPKIRFNGSKLSTGVYFYSLSVTGLERDGKYSSAGKMLLLK